MTRLILAACLLLAATGVSAASFSALDRNGDGVLSYPEAEREFRDLSEVHFLKADRNGDGAIGPDELPLLRSIYQTMYIAH